MAVEQFASFRESIERRSLKVLGLGGSAVFFGYHAILRQPIKGGGSRSIALNGSAALLGYGVLAVVPGVVAVFTLSLIVRRQPDVSMTAEELVVAYLPRAKRVLRRDIAAIEEPWTVRQRLVSSTRIRVRARDGRSVTIAPSFEGTTPQDVYAELVRWWRDERSP